MFDTATQWVEKNDDGNNDWEQWGGDNLLTIE